MTATRALAKKRREFFEKKAFAKGKKLKTRRVRPFVEARFLRTQRRGPFRIGAGFPVARVLRPAARVLKKPTFVVPPPKTRRGRRRRSRSKSERPSGGARRSVEREQTSFLLLSTPKICQRGAARGWSGDRTAFEGRSKRFGVADQNADSRKRSALRRSSSAPSLYCLILLYIVFSLTPSLRAASRRQPLQATSVSRKAARSICGSVNPASPSEGDGGKSARSVERKETGRSVADSTGLGRASSATETQDSSLVASRDRR